MSDGYRKYQYSSISGEKPKVLLESLKNYLSEYFIANFLKYDLLLEKSQNTMFSLSLIIFFHQFINIIY